MTSILERLQAVHQQRENSERKQEITNILQTIESEGMDESEDKRKVLDSFLLILSNNVFYYNDEEYEELARRVMNVLSNKGAIDVIPVDDLHSYILSSSFLVRNLSIGKLLLEKVQDVNMRDSKGNTLLHSAAANVDRSIIQELIERGADLDTQDAKGRTALAILIDKFVRAPIGRPIGIRDIEPMIKILVENGANPNISDKYGIYPLNLIIYDGSLYEQVPTFIKYGFCMWNKSEGICFAMSEKLEGCEEYLVFHIEKYFELAKEAGLDEKSIKQEKDDYQNIKRANSDDKIKQLKELYHSLESKIKCAQKKMHDIEEYKVIAKQIREKKNFEFSLPEGININVQDKYTGNSLLHLAVQYKNLEAVKFLIERGINVNLQNNMKRTALLISAINKNSDIEDALLKANSDTQIQDRYGITHDKIKKMNALANAKARGTWYKRLLNLFTKHKNPEGITKG